MEMPKTNIMKMRLEKRCVICEKRAQEGIMIASSLICSPCEKAIVQTEETDELYNRYVEKMKSLSSQYI
ncbi:Inhibitor of sigma-G Gin [Halalkalibacter krulwichiae]|uniref:Inhibitor of sigma-G Gin n=2 Tax=Halalkalibacter krulwichiae TaxID=199441 RepID=A0A1X9M718_9BACI|nr:Inhibitor of sigma-G Gin [Halalkalibacter krulwichiae]